MTDRPNAAADLEITEVKHGLIVYDATREGLHYLNRLPSIVFALCDGTRTATEIAEELEAIIAEAGANPNQEDSGEVVRRLVDDLRQRSIVS